MQATVLVQTDKTPIQQNAEPWERQKKKPHRQSNDDMGTNLVRLVKFSMTGIINLKKITHNW